MPPEETDAKLDPRYLQGIEQFNRRQYHEGHDAWEELWIETTGHQRDFYKGLIQAAIALYHLENGNTVGAQRLWAGCRRLLAPYRPKHLGLDLELLLDDMSRWLDPEFPGPPGKIQPGETGGRVPPRMLIDLK